MLFEQFGDTQCAKNIEIFFVAFDHDYWQLISFRHFHYRAVVNAEDNYFPSLLRHPKCIANEIHLKPAPRNGAAVETKCVGVAIDLAHDTFCSQIIG